MSPVPVDGFVETAVMVLLAAGALISFARLVRGPTLPDRVVALDLLTIMGLGMLATYALATGDAVYLDIGIVLALVTFLATIAFAYYIEKGQPRGGRR